ncbi:MAG TPA: hypothetical protein VNT79_03615 [Phycisphaerae bacterium]|nr:hypothetical protein [Phycisphaerae bacterium]
MTQHDPEPIPIVHYTVNRVANPGDEPLTWSDFHIVRNGLVHLCRRHGKTGPRGILRFTAEETRHRKTLADLGDDHFEPGDAKPLYLVATEQDGDNRYLSMSLTDRCGLTEDWLLEIMALLEEYPGWGVCVEGFRRGSLIIFADKIMVTGPRFKPCRTLAEVVKEGRQ